MGARRLFIGLTGVNAVLVVALFAHSHRASAASDQGTVRARAIELVDERGQVRAQLNVETDGEVVFRLRDSKGEIRVKLGAGDDGSGLLLLDGSTEPRIHMLAKSSGSSVTLTSKGGQQRVITP
jgi:hypothetical protein